MVFRVCLSTDFRSIWEAAGLTKNSKADVFNGISISIDPDILYVTGKQWDHMFKIKLLLPDDAPRQQLM